MNQAEIMTLLSSKVKPTQIRVAIMAGKLSTILHRADQQVAQAKEFKDGANWTEILRLLEGEYESKTDQMADSPKKRNDFD